MEIWKPKYTRTELDKINDFLLQLAREISYRKIRMVYRGDKLENLFERLNIFYNPPTPNIEQVLEYLFMLGEKGRHFYSDSIAGYSGSTFEVDDVGKAQFAYIFDKIAAVSKSLKKHHRDFFRNNGSFSDYFQNKTNKPIFLAAIENLNTRIRLPIKNYYLSLLHQLAAVNYKKKSAFVSTSEDKNIAKQFANHSGLKPGVLLHVWTPSPISILKYFKGSGLPMYKQAPFKKQEEISFFAGILPHYIIGLEVIGKAMFYNPAIINNDITFLTFVEGFQIDQTNFESYRKKSSYKSSFLTDGIDYIQ